MEGENNERACLYRGGEIGRQACLYMEGEIEGLDCLYMEEERGIVFLCSLLPVLSVFLPCCKTYTRPLF
jgi:hypothetical protein